MTGARAAPSRSSPGADADPPPATIPVDYRDSLANERTFLAWSRTALSLIAGAVAVVKLVPPFTVAGARLFLGLVLAAAGLLMAIAAYRRWARNEHAMSLGQPLPRGNALVWVSATIALVALGILVLAATDRSS